MREIKMTDDQRNKLVMFLLMTTKYREREIEACTNLGKETNEDGTLKYPNLKANGEWWSETHEVINGIIELL